MSWESLLNEKKYEILFKVLKSVDTLKLSSEGRPSPDYYEDDLVQEEDDFVFE
jgi:hypothetical protein